MLWYGAVRCCCVVTLLFSVCGRQRQAERGASGMVFVNRCILDAADVDVCMWQFVITVTFQLPAVQLQLLPIRMVSTLWNVYVSSTFGISALQSIASKLLTSKSDSIAVLLLATLALAVALVVLLVLASVAIELYWMEWIRRCLKHSSTQSYQAVLMNSIFHSLVRRQRAKRVSVFLSCVRSRISWFCDTVLSQLDDISFFGQWWQCCFSAFVYADGIASLFRLNHVAPLSFIEIPSECMASF